MAKGKKRRPREKPATVDYVDAEGNRLTLRQELSAGTIAKLEAGPATAATSREDAWHRRSELLYRRTQESDRGREELAAILREAERMASIVKKIGKITRYETTPYVGKTRIVDLDRASKPPVVVIRDKP